MTRYLCFPGGRRKALTFSYDDGVEEDIRLTGIFRKYGMKATFNINSGSFGPDDGSNPTGRKHRKLSRKEAKEIYTEDLFEVACHGVNHESLTICDSASAVLDVIDDRRNLEDLFAKQIHGMAYANGLVNDQVTNILKVCGIWYSRTTVSTGKFDMPENWLKLPATCHHKNPRLMELAEQFLTMKTRLPAVFYVWGHAYEFADADNWHVMEDFCEKMAGHEDIWYCTNMELYLAWRDYQRLESSADGKHIYNPSPRSVWIRDKGAKVYEIKPNETITME